MPNNNRTIRKQRLNKKLKEVGASALSHAGTGAGLGYSIGHLLQKNPNSIRATKVGTAAGLLTGAAVGAIRQYRKNNAKKIR